MGHHARVGFRRSTLMSPPTLLNVHKQKLETPRLEYPSLLHPYLIDFMQYLQIGVGRQGRRFSR